MTTQLAGSLTVLGLLAIGLGFFLLQRLRVRQRTVVVETTLFWRQALEATRARVLVQRFRHPWVYALLVGIATALWLSFAQLSSTGDADRQSLVLIDGSAAMAPADRFAATLEMVHDLVDELPAENRTVVLCGGAPRTVLRPGEHAQLLRERLAHSQPEACPSILEAVIRTRLAVPRRGPLQVYVAGDARVDADFVALLPADVTLSRLAAPGTDATENAGITALGIAPAKSGAWDRVDLLVEVRATVGVPTAPALQLAGGVLTTAAETEKIGAVARFIYRDLPARGGLLVATLPDDANSLDNRASFVLPKRRQRRVAIEAGLPAVLTSVIAADPALVLATGPADVVMRRGGSSFGGPIPAIELVAEQDQEQAFLIQCRADEDPDKVVLQLHDRLGLAEIDATEVAGKMGKVIAMGAVQGKTRGLRLWQSLLSPEFNFVQSRSFPLFIALSVRWIGGVWEPPRTLPAGRPTELGNVQLADAAGRPQSSLGDAFTPPIAGLFTTAEGQRLAVALLDPDITAAGSLGAPGAALAKAELSGFGLDLPTFLLLLALGLLVFEWVMFQQGRLP